MVIALFFLPPLSFQLTVEMFDYLECELNLFLGGKLLFWSDSTLRANRCAYLSMI